MHTGGSNPSVSANGLSCEIISSIRQLSDSRTDRQTDSTAIIWPIGEVGYHACLSRMRTPVQVRHGSPLKVYSQYLVAEKLGVEEETIKSLILVTVCWSKP